MTKKLLLADDSVTIQKVVSISFANEDVQVITVDNGDDALLRARESVPDVVLADVQMPGRSGYEVCEALKADPALSHIPVLLLSGTFESFDEERARAVGAAGHVTKPFEAQVLVERVTELLSAPATVEAEPEQDDDALGFELLSEEAEDVAERSGPAVLGRVEPVTVRGRPSEVPVATELEPDDVGDLDAPDATVAFVGDEGPPPLPGPASEAAWTPDAPSTAAASPPDWDADDAFDWPTEDGSTRAAGDPVEDAAGADLPPPLPGEGEDASRAGYDEIFDFDIERGTAAESFTASGRESERGAGEAWDETVWSPEPAAAVPVTPLAEPWEDPEPPPTHIEPSGIELEAPPAAETELTAEAIPDGEEADPGGAAASAAGVSPALRRELQASLEKVAWDAFGDLSERIVKEVLARVEAVAWEVIPQMAETLIREEIERLKDGGGETR